MTAPVTAAHVDPVFFALGLKLNETRFTRGGQHLTCHLSKSYLSTVRKIWTWVVLITTMGFPRSQRPFNWGDFRAFLVFVRANVVGKPTIYIQWQIIVSFQVVDFAAMPLCMRGYDHHNRKNKSHHSWLNRAQSPFLCMKSPGFGQETAWPPASQAINGSASVGDSWDAEISMQ